MTKDKKEREVAPAMPPGPPGRAAAGPAEGQGRAIPGAPAEPPNERFLAAEGRRERHRREIFERLVGAARELMFTRGLDHSTVREITEIADVGKGTFFNYFPTKGHVVSEFVQARNQSLNEVLADARAGRTTAEAAFVTFIAEKLWPPSGGDWLAYYRSIIAAMAEDVLVRASVAERMSQQRAGYESLIQEGQTRGEFRTDFSAADLATYLHRFIVGYSLSSWTDSLEPAITADGPLMRMMLAMLKGPGGAGPRDRKTAAPGRKPSARKTAARARKVRSAKRG